MKIYNPFKKNFSKQELSAFEFLSNVSYFSKFTIEEFEDIFPYLHLRTYKQNEVVFFRNDPSQAVYVVKSGKIEINLDVKDIFEVVETAKSGNIIGEGAFLPKKRRKFNAIVTSDDCEIYVFPQVSIFEIFNKYPAIKTKILEVYADNLEKKMENILRSYRENHGFFELSQAFQIDK